MFRTAEWTDDQLEPVENGKKKSRNKGRTEDALTH